MNQFALVIVIILVIFSALFSGLNLGLMSLNPFELKRKLRLGDEDARRVYPIRKNGNQLLVTLLLGNVLVNAILSVFLGSITTGVVAVVVSTGLIVLFGEIVPQALFSRYALRFGARFAFLTRIFMVLLYPLAMPVGWILDKILGREIQAAYSKEELALVIEEQERLKQSDLDHDELEILQGGLEYSEVRVEEVMTPAQNAFVVEDEAILDDELLKTIHAQGHSRIPVFSNSKTNIVGLLFVKDLAVVNPEDEVKVQDLMRSGLVTVKRNAKLDTILNKFREKRLHLFIVINEGGEFAGLVTLEDVLEEIIGEIVDEHDRLADMRKKDSVIKKRSF